MSVITGVLGTIAEFEERVQQQDPLLLNSEERASPHMLGHTEGGRDLRISMPRGTELNDGDVLALDGDTAIVVQAAPDNFWTLLGKLVSVGGWALLLVVLVPMLFSWLMPGPVQFKAKK